MNSNSQLPSSSKSGGDDDEKNTDKVATVTAVSQLSGVLNVSSHRPLNTLLNECVYMGRVVSSTKIDGRNNSVNHNVVYRLMRRHATNVLALAAPDPQYAIGQAFMYNEALSSQFTGMARKYSNFVAEFKQGDMSAILCRLGQMLACYRCTGRLAWGHVMAGRHLNIRCISVLDEPVGASDTCIFIPRVASELKAPSTFAALVAAANSTGSMVITDVLAVAVANNAPQITTFSDGELAVGAFNAVRVLMAMMHASDCGAIAAFAFVKGLHETITVVGHTDEGAYMRDVWRRCCFVPSYGGIYVANASSFLGLPLPMRNNVVSMQAVIDTILLKSAALVAICDPCVVLDGRTYPTVITSNGAAGDGSHQAGEAGDSIPMQTRLASFCGDFVDIYVPRVAALFGLAGCDSTACNMMVHMFGSVAESRHMQYKVVAPYFWIEPTTLFTASSGTVAEKAGFGILCDLSTGGRAMDAFNNYTVVSTNANYSFVQCEWISARLHGLLIHHQLSPNDGLAAVTLHQANYGGFANRGGVNESIQASVEADRNIGEYLWRRGDSALPMPAEFVYASQDVMLKLTHYVTSAFELFGSTNIMNSKELCEHVKFNLTAARPSLITGDLPRRDPHEVARSRTQAAAALSTVHGWIRSGYVTGGEEIARGNIVPGLRSVRIAETGDVGTDQDQLDRIRQPLDRLGLPMPHVAHQSSAKVRLPHAPAQQEAPNVANRGQEGGGVADRGGGAEQGAQPAADAANNANLEGGAEAQAPPIQ